MSDDTEWIILELHGCGLLLMDTVAFSVKINNIINRSIMLNLSVMKFGHLGASEYTLAPSAF